VVILKISDPVVLQCLYVRFLHRGHALDSNWVSSLRAVDHVDRVDRAVDHEKLTARSRCGDVMFLDFEWIRAAIVCFFHSPHVYCALSIRILLSLRHYYWTPNSYTSQLSQFTTLQHRLQLCKVTITWVLVRQERVTKPACVNSTWVLNIFWRQVCQCQY